MKRIQSEQGRHLAPKPAPRPADEILEEILRAAGLESLS